MEVTANVIAPRAIAAESFVARKLGLAGKTLRRLVFVERIIVLFIGFICNALLQGIGYPGDDCWSRYTSKRSCDSLNIPPGGAPHVSYATLPPGQGRGEAISKERSFATVSNFPS